MSAKANKRRAFPGGQTGLLSFQLRPRLGGATIRFQGRHPALALQLRFWKASESMGNHDLEIVDAGSVD